MARGLQILEDLVILEDPGGGELCRAACRAHPAPMEQEAICCQNLRGWGCAKHPGLRPAMGTGSSSPAGAAQGWLTPSGSSQVEPVSSTQGEERPRTREVSGDAVAQ